jgi:hypothetical protein
VFLGREANHWDFGNSGLIGSRTAIEHIRGKEHPMRKAFATLFAGTLLLAGGAAKAYAPQYGDAGPGIPGSEAVDPAPGASKPYLGVGYSFFYHPNERMAEIERRLDSLSPSERQRARAALRSVQAEERAQIARHGELRDWDYENINYRLNKLEQRFPELLVDQRTAQNG